MAAAKLLVAVTGIVDNFAGLFVARVFLGITEAGLFPGVVSHFPHLTVENALMFSLFGSKAFFRTISFPIAPSFAHPLRFAVTMWYKRYEVNLRIAVFFSAA